MKIYDIVVRVTIKVKSKAHLRYWENTIINQTEKHLSKYGKRIPSVCLSHICDERGETVKEG